MIAAMKRKREIEKSLLELEVQLYNYETSYLEKYSAIGTSLIRDFDATAFLGNSTSTSTPANSSSFAHSYLDKKAPLDGSADNNMRIFSNSSCTTQKALLIKRKIAEKLTAIGEPGSYGRGRAGAISAALPSAQPKISFNLKTSLPVKPSKNKKMDGHTSDEYDAPESFSQISSSDSEYESAVEDYDRDKFPPKKRPRPHRRP